jgi:carbon monoxide dehydrogenase subunit G
MEVKLDKRYEVAAGVEQAWTVLSDIRAVGACMPGAQITDQVDDTHYKGTVKTRIGPASMQFNGDIEVLGLDAATRSLQMLGKGADRGGSSASMKLSAHIEPGQTADTCVLVGQATVTVSGKLAQFGSRLLVPVSDAMLAQFADHFRAAAAAVVLPAPVDAGTPGAAASSAACADDGASPTPMSPAVTESEAAVGAVTGSAPGVLSPASAPAPVAAPDAPKAAPPVATELNALALMWTVFKGWLAGLFGKR